MKKTIVIGGGFFGAYIAEFLALSGHSVLLVEREDGLMLRASYNNQARVHGGYHYPRSILTALRSRQSFPRFVDEFRDAVVSDFEKYYLIGSPLSKVSATQYRTFCQRIGAPCDTAPDRIRRLTNPHYVEACFSTIEYAFDATVIRDAMVRRLQNAGVELRFGVAAETLQHHNNQLVLTLRHTDGAQEDVAAEYVFNCTYSNINYLLGNSRAETIPLKHEMTEMCLVEVPEEIRQVGITVMCGPFFSVMPFPAEGLHSFSHVRYTPHYEWQDKGATDGDTAAFHDPAPTKTAWEYMRKDAARYLPILNDCTYKRSLWEVKTVLPRSETDDSRPILFRPDPDFAGLFSVVGGKIDNVYDVISAIQANGIGK